MARHSKKLTGPAKRGNSHSPSEVNKHRAELRKRFSAGRWVQVSRDFLAAFTIEEAFVLSYLASMGDQRATEHPNEEEWFQCQLNKMLKDLRITARVHDRIMAQLEEAEVVARRVTGRGKTRKRLVYIDYLEINRLVEIGLNHEWIDAD